MKVLIFLSILSISCAETPLLCNDCAKILCGPVRDCGPDAHNEPGDRSLCECCAKCVPNRQLYDPCKNDEQCAAGLKCSTSQLCVNESCDPNVCTWVKCAVVDKCEKGIYKKYFMCGCCSSCAKYLEIGEKCTDEGVKCGPDLECSKQTGTCVEICIP
uniref:IGFBP N-terminal domain-containing protein n=1 Tax=Strigamia maritima TaxID=126957 RepID=T1IZE5_STRMM